MILHHEFIKCAKKEPNKIILSDKSLNKDLTYSQLFIASYIFSKKIKKYKGSLIGIMLPNSAAAFISVCGTILSGKVPVMINYSTGAIGNCKYAQKKCGFRTIVSSRALMEKLSIPLIKGIIFIEDILSTITMVDKVKTAALFKLPTNVLLKMTPQSEEDDNAVILFTSGSEKSPKAVQLTHKNLISNLKAMLKTVNWSTKDKILSALPFFHVFGYNVNLWLPLIFSIKSVSYANPLDYAKIVSIIKEEQITLLISTPSFFSGYLKRSKPGDLSSIWLAIPGADATPKWLREAYLKDHGIKLYEGYGTTETSPVISFNNPDNYKPGSIGKVIPGLKVRICDINTGEILDKNKEGKIMVKGPAVMKGYFDDIEETMLRVKDGWYDTGDIGLIDDEDYLWHKGRLKRFVKIGGEMVSLVKIESVILEELKDDNIECCVTEVPDAIKGVRIVVVLNKKINEKKLMKKIANRLVPIERPKKFVYFKEFPKMGSGKVDFRAVKERVYDLQQREEE